MTDAGREASHLAVTVVPRASRNRIASLADGAWRIHLTAPPVDGAANDALVKYLASLLNVPRSRIRIAAGHQSRHKRLHIEGLDFDAVAERLRKELDQQR
jgi:uncharacterized protein (TIGR00251 family)